MKHPNPNQLRRLNNSGLAVLAAAALATICLSGCQATPKRIAFTSLHSVALAVDAARGAYVEAYQAGKIESPDTHARVIVLDRNYTDAMNLAINAAQYDWGTPAIPEVCALAAQLIEFIGELTNDR